MADSEVGICNDGLAQLGHTQFIQSLEEDSEEARLCKRFYEQQRDATLREWNWRFAKRVVALSQTGVEPEEWDYQYTYPTDCLFARRLISGVRDRTQRPKWEVQIDADLHSRVIVTDEDGAKLVYTARVIDPFAFNALFKDSLSWRMAMMLAMPLTKEPKLQQAAANGYRFAIGQARLMDAIEAQEDDKPESELIRIRQ